MNARYNTLIMETPKKVRIVFPKTGQECEVDCGDTLADATFRYDLPIRFRCERAVCTTCLTEVIEGAENLSEMEPREEQTLKAIKAQSQWRLACQVIVSGDVKLDYLPITDPRRKPAEDATLI